jgi:hypothetical protein
MLGLITHMQMHGASLPNGKSMALPNWVQYDPNPDMSDPLCPMGKQRTLLQWWGTEYRRKNDPFYWVKKLKHTLDKDKPRVAIITDVRFKTEYFFVKINGGFTVKIVRTGFQLSDPVARNHVSEHELDDETFDYVIEVEDGNLPELQRDAVTVFDMIADTFTPIDTNFQLEEFDGSAVPDAHSNVLST